MDIENNLKELDLDENQINVYLACLQLGSAKVHDISIKANMIRTTCYGILKSLVEKGLISTIKKNNITFYQASSPQQLLHLLDEKKEKINSIIPALEKLHTQIPKKHSVEAFEGKEGLKTIINDLLKTPNETIYIVGFIKKWIGFSEVFSDIFYRKKKEMNINSQVLIDKSEIHEIQNKKIYGSEFKYLENIETDAECFIYHDKIAFVSFEENNLKGVIVQDSEMAKLQKKIFNELWRTAQNIPPS